MSLPADIQVALSLLQILGLLIPIVFVILQPLLAPGDSFGEKGEVELDVGFVSTSMTTQRTPALVYSGLAVISCLALAAVFVAIRLYTFVWGSPLIVAGVVFLILGVVGLVVIVYQIRREFEKAASV